MIPVLLKDIPDPEEIGTAATLEWLAARRAFVRSAVYTHTIQASARPYMTEQTFSTPLGAEGSAHWRRLYLATLLADWASYEREEDLVDAARLKYVLTSAYPYLRLWFCTFETGEVLPVGYTLWYPLAPAIYDWAIGIKKPLTDRGFFLPDRSAGPDWKGPVYVFNISLTDTLRNSRISSRIIRTFQHDDAKQNHPPAIAIVVGAGGGKFSLLSGFREIYPFDKAETEYLFARS